MLLRPRQKEFVDRRLEALEKHGNALGVAPTGAGKTILFSEIVGRLVKSGTAVLDGNNLGELSNFSQPIEVGFSEPPSKPAIVSLQVAIRFPFDN